MEMLGCLIEGEVVEQDGAEDRALRLDIGRHAVRETVIGGCQGIVSPESVNSC